jgi:hypothetical protein
MGARVGLPPPSQILVLRDALRAPQDEDLIHLARCAVEDFVVASGGSGFDLLIVASLVGQSLRHRAGVTFTAAAAGVHPEETCDVRHKHRDQAQQGLQQGLAEPRDTTPVCD